MRCAEHAATCPACAALVEGYRELGTALAGLLGPEPPADFTAGVMATIAEREADAAFGRRLAAVILVSAVALAALAMGLAGASAWVPAITAAGVDAAGAWWALGLATDVLAPLARAFRLQLVAVALAASFLFLAALWRLLPRRAGAARA